MKSIQYIILLFLFISSTDLSAQFQTTWIRTERDTPIISGFNQIEDMVIDDSGFIYVNGTIDTFQTTAPVFISYDSTGAERWRRTINGLGLDFSWRIFLTPAGHIICAGHYEDNSGTNNFIYTEFNSIGDSIGGGIMNAPGFATGDDLEDACIDHSGNLYMAGQIRSGNDFLAAVCCFDSLSNLKWLSSYPLQPGWNSSDIRGIEMCGDTGMYCLTFNFTGKASLLYCDTSGVFRWNKILPTAVNQYHTSLSTDIFGNALAGGNFNNSLGLEKIRPNGDSAWFVQYSFPGLPLTSPELLNIKSDSSGNIYTMSASFGIPSYSLITAFDSNGVILWMDTAAGLDHIYGYNKEFFELHNGIITFTTTSGGSRLYQYTIAGQQITNQALIIPGLINPEVNTINTQGQNLYIAGSSYNGFNLRAGFTARLDQTINSVKEEFTDQHFEIFPNPANDFIILKTDDTEPGIKLAHIYDTDGKLIKQINITSERSYIDLCGLSNGIYYLSLSVSGNNVIKQFQITK